MAELTSGTYQYLTQLPLLRQVDASTGPEGPHGVTAFFLVPTNGYHGSQRFPHNVAGELEDASFDKTVVEGVEYFLVPESSTNLPGRIAHYAQTTGVADLANPPGGGVNRARETFENTAESTVAPDAVAKYVEENDSFEEARTKASDEDARVERQVTVSPAREPAEGKLVENTPEEGPKKVVPRKIVEPSKE